MSSAVRRVAIAGGGLAAWASAAALARALDGADVDIVVADSGAPAGEPLADHTLPSSLVFFSHLGLAERDVLRAGRATFRLGTRFTDWPRAGDSRQRPFGATGANVGFIPFHHYLTRRRLAGDAAAAERFSVNAVAIAAGRVAPGALAARLEHGLNLGRAGCAELLRGTALAAGVRRVVGEIADVTRREPDGMIERLRLADGTSIDAELFVDATGSDAGLIGEALGVPFRACGSLFPVNLAASLESASDGEPPLVTTCRALPDGWLLDVPLAGRSARTLLTAIGVLSPDAAAARLRELCAVPDGTAVALAPFASGRRENAWSANCVAVGAAAAIVEPLVCSELHGLQSDILRLLRLFPPADCPSGLRDEYNAEARREYDAVCDYLLTLYAVPGLRGEPFWRRAAAGEPPASFLRRRDLFASSGRLAAFESDPFGADDWVTAWLSAGVEPRDYDPLLARMSLAELNAHFSRMAGAIAAETNRLPTHGAALAAASG